MRGPGWGSNLLLVLAVLPYLGQSWWTWGLAITGILLSFWGQARRTAPGITLTLLGGLWLVRCDACHPSVAGHMADADKASLAAQDHAAWHVRQRRGL